MTVLDSGGVSALAGDRALVNDLVQRHAWPPVVPAVVLVETLTGDHRRDFAVERLLRSCLVQPVDESISRQAGRLRTATGRAGSISAVDAVVAAAAVSGYHESVLTSDPRDLGALLDAHREVAVVAV